MRNLVARTIEEPLLRKQKAGEYWELMEDYVVSPNGVTFTIPKGFLFDIASVPEILHWLVDQDELGVAGPLVHDALYLWKGDLPPGWVVPKRCYTRMEADTFLYKISLLSGAKPWRAKLAWLAVRAFGTLKKKW